MRTRNYKNFFIFEGNISPLRVRIKDIATRAGVSTGTVDRVLHNRGEVSPKTREKVLGILQEMHYEPDILASALASKRPVRVAIVVPRPTAENWFWKEPLAGIGDALEGLAHFRIETHEFLFDSFKSEDFVSRAESALEFKPDAVIAAPVFANETKDFFGKCNELGIPFVSVNDNTGHPGQLAFIGQDARQSGAVAAHLFRIGSNPGDRILVVSIAGDRDNNNHILKREEGFRDYWKMKGINNRVEILNHAIPEDNYRFISNSLEGLLQKTKQVCGIFVTNSRVYQAARYLAVKGLNDILLVGYDLIGPNVTYMKAGIINFLISQKPREQGYRAMLAVINKLKMNREPEREQILPIDIVCTENINQYNQ